MKETFRPGSLGAKNSKELFRRSAENSFQNRVVVKVGLLLSDDCILDFRFALFRSFRSNKRRSFRDKDFRSLLAREENRVALLLILPPNDKRIFDALSKIDIERKPRDAFCVLGWKRRVFPAVVGTAKSGDGLWKS